MPELEIDQEYEVVPIDSIEEHPQNPKVGAEELIDESMDVNGWYGAVVCQRSSRRILVGNHRHRVAKRKGATHIPVIWRDVDDETAVRILLVDNRSSEAGHFDEEMLDTVLSGLETLEGTGYGHSALGALEESLEAEEGREEVPEDEGAVPEDRYTPSYGVIVVCEDESHQERVYNELAEAGHQVRVVAV